MSNKPTQQLIKDVAALRQKKGRDETGLILVEGRHPIEEALQAGLTVVHYFTIPEHPGGLPAKPVPVAPYAIDNTTMKRMATTDSEPPCLAVFKRPTQPTKLKGSLILALDGIQDPGNLGTLIRSALAFGAGSILLTEDSVEPYNPKVIRASAGLVFALPILVQPREKLLQFCPETEWSVYATTGQANALPYRQANFQEPSVILLGNEGQGVSTQFLENPRIQPLTIPMREQVESLNVAISGAIILAEADAQRREALP